jgi:phenylacetic acid degradation operon negative regulatory protein
MAVVQSARPRAAGPRAALRTALRRLDMAEWREGVWLRPDNLGDPAGRLPEVARVVTSQCQWLACRLAGDDDRGLAARLWDLSGWASEAGAFAAGMEGSIGDLRGGDASALRPAFLLAASVLRHLAADPLLPDELLPGRWPGGQLRRAYDRYEAALQSGLRRWFRDEA